MLGEKSAKQKNLKEPLFLKSPLGKLVTNRKGKYVIGTGVIDQDSLPNTDINVNVIMTKVTASIRWATFFQTL